MNKILELREKRAKVWEQAKAFLDSKRGESGLISAEDTAAYEKMEADVVALGKEVERLERQASLDIEMSRPTSRPLTSKPVEGGEVKEGRASAEYNSAFWKAMRNKNHLDIQNSLRIGEKEDGGYLVPDEFEKKIIDALQDENIFRKIANVIQTSHGERKIPVVASHGTAAWVDENEEIPESDEKFGQITLNAHKLATLIKISEELLQDSVFNLEAYIAKEFARRIGRAEEEAFLVGSGTGRPTGVLNGEAIATANAAISADDIIDLYHSLREPYRKSAVFITNDQTVKLIRKLKDANGQYLWQPSLQAGTPDSILGRPFKTSVFVPTAAAGKKVLAFGDFSYYWIADRQGRSFQRLNELFAVTGQVGFKATQRVDGKLTLQEAVKILKIKE